MSFLDRLNTNVKSVDVLPRVRFEADLSPSATGWLARKHSNGAVHEPGMIGALWTIAAVYPERKVIFDLGALYGYFSLLCRVLFDQSAGITAFDMHPASFVDLCKNVTPFDIKCVNTVLSDEIKKVKFWVSGFNIFEEPEGGWDNLPNIPGAMKQRGPNNRGRFFAEGDFTTLDAYCADNEAPDVIKIDVEGFQAKAIKGGLKTIAAKKPVIVIELHDPEKLARFNTTNKDTVQPLYDLGYRGYWCGNFRDKDATFEAVEQMQDKHEKLSVMVFTHG